MNRLHFCMCWKERVNIKLFRTPIRTYSSSIRGVYQLALRLQNIYKLAPSTIAIGQTRTGRGECKIQSLASPKSLFPIYCRGDLGNVGPTTPNTIMYNHMKRVTLPILYQMSFLVVKSIFIIRLPSLPSFKRHHTLPPP